MISRHTGEQLGYIEQLRQSVNDILTTPIGSRVMRRNYGSMLPEFIDQPLTDALVLMCYSAIYTALYEWEPRLVVDQIDIERIAHGRMQVALDVALAEGGEPFTLTVQLNMGR